MSMTVHETLDKQALEKAMDAFGSEWAASFASTRRCVETAIRAYLDALPPAVSAWARPELFLANSGFEVHRDYRAFNGGQIVPVEIREVRS